MKTSKKEAKPQDKTIKSERNRLSIMFMFQFQCYIVCNFYTWYAMKKSVLVRRHIGILIQGLLSKIKKE